MNKFFTIYKIADGGFIVTASGEDGVFRSGPMFATSEFEAAVGYIKGKFDEPKKITQMGKE